MDMIGHNHRRYDMPVESGYRLAKGGESIVVVQHVSASVNAEGDEINDALIESDQNRDARRMTHPRDANGNGACRASAPGCRNMDGKQECLPYMNRGDVTNRGCNDLPF